MLYNVFFVFLWAFEVLEAKLENLFRQEQSECARSRTQLFRDFIKKPRVTRASACFSTFQVCEAKQTATPEPKSSDVQLVEKGYNLICSAMAAGAPPQAHAAWDSFCRKHPPMIAPITRMYAAEAHKVNLLCLSFSVLVTFTTICVRHQSRRHHHLYNQRVCLWGGLQTQRVSKNLKTNLKSDRQKSFSRLSPNRNRYNRQAQALLSVSLTLRSFWKNLTRRNLRLTSTSTALVSANLPKISETKKMRKYSQSRTQHQRRNSLSLEKVLFFTSSHFFC